MRSLIEGDVDMSRSATLERYETESEGGASLKSPIKIRKQGERDEGVDKRLEKLKEKLMAELKSQVGAHTSLRTSSLFVTRI